MIEERMNEMESRADAHYTDTSPNRPPYIDLSKNEEYRQLIRAFRLKHFGRCPKCDNYLLRSPETLDFYCEQGHFSVAYNDVLSASDQDKFLYDLCKEGGGK